MTTTPEVRSALDEARTIRDGERQAVEEQQKADKQFAQMHRDCATLLEDTPDSRQTHLVKRIFIGLASKTLALIFSQFRHLGEISIADLGDYRRMSTSLNGVGEPINVTLASEDAAPTKSGSFIDLHVQGLAETLRMNHTHADVLSSTIVLQFNSEYSLFIRRANSIDATRYQPVVDELTKPHA